MRKHYTGSKMDLYSILHRLFHQEVDEISEKIERHLASLDPRIHECNLEIKQALNEARERLEDSSLEYPSDIEITLWLKHIAELKREIQERLLEQAKLEMERVQREIEHMTHKIEAEKNEK